MVKNHIAELEKRLWDVADELRANSDLKSSEYSPPVLGLIFLKYADYRFTRQEKILSEKSSSRRKIGKTDYQAAGVMYLPNEARFSHLLNLPEGADIGKAINEAMKAIERENGDLKSVLPKTYNRFKNNLLVELIKVEEEGDGFDFKERLEELNEELETLNTEAKELEEQISENVAKILGVK